MSFAVDVNVLLYATDSTLPEYNEARDFRESCMEGPDLFYIAWPTVMGYLRMATHPSLFASPLTPDEAEKNIQALISLPHVRMLAEAEGFWDCYRSISTDLPIRGNLVPDAHLAALLRQHGVKTIFTRDRDFRKFPFLKVKDPFSK